jgi:exosortase K
MVGDCNDGNRPDHHPPPAVAPGMKPSAIWRRNAQLLVVLLCAFALKLYYSTASPNLLRWILAPTTFFVELVSGIQFEFESHAGYINRDRTFLIAASCAGVNFLITAFLMLSLRKLWRYRTQTISWSFIPIAALFAYLATLVANTVRISVALRLQRAPSDSDWLTPNQLHRFEGIFIYFGFLLLLFVFSEKIGLHKASGLLRQSLFPLLVYYVTTLGIPLANSAYRQPDFWEHSLFVLMTPLLPILLLTTMRFCESWRAQCPSQSTLDSSAWRKTETIGAIVTEFQPNPGRIESAFLSRSRLRP